MLKHQPWFIKLTNREFFPSWVIQFPLFFYVPYLMLRARAIGFFSAANPAIYAGGLIGERKHDIYDITPSAYLPITIYCERSVPTEEMLRRIAEAGISYPLIAKPDIGERGIMVRKIKDEAALIAYIEQCKPVMDFLFQEFIDYPLEAAVYYIRKPSEPKGQIFSLCLKKFLSVTGDGKLTLRQLIEAYPRAILVKERMFKLHAEHLETILPIGEELLLEPIGNHVRGTTFLNGEADIDEQLASTFDQITAQIKGLYFCRYDLKCTSMADLKAGRNIKVVEINGVGAEPAHIYDPNYTLWKTWVTLIRQFRLMYEVAKENHALGTPYMSLAELRTMNKVYNTAMIPIRAMN